MSDTSLKTVTVSYVGDHVFVDVTHDEDVDVTLAEALGLLEMAKHVLLAQYSS